MQIDKYIKQLSECGYEVYRPSSTLAFALKEEKILYITPFHLFRIKWEHVNYRNRMRKLSEMIRNEEVCDVIQLTEFCSPKPGKNSKMYGLTMVHTKIEYHIGEWA